MGEQLIDLFTAGAYALAGRVYGALANPSLAWLFYLLAAGGIVFAIIESALEQRPDFWLRHLMAVSLAAVLTLAPRSIDISMLTYAAPGLVEKMFDTHFGAAPHLTYWIERLGAAAATGLRNLTHQQTCLAVPGVAAQVAEIAADTATINDPQLKANLEIWRRRIVPQMLIQDPDLAQQVEAAGLGPALLSPLPQAQQFVGAPSAARANAVTLLLARSQVKLPVIVAAQSTLLNQISQDAGANAWEVPSGVDGSVLISFASPRGALTARRMSMSDPAYDDALRQGDRVLQDMRSQLSSEGTAVPVASADQLYDLLGRSVLYTAGSRLAADTAARAALGSLCQRAGVSVCSSAMAPLFDAAQKLRVPEADRYNSRGWTTWLQQPIATTLLTITSLMLSTLSTLVVSVLPFALGVAKSMAILISMVGTWLLLWPGRARIALSWMVGPISFVSLWSVLFNLWSDIEPSLTQIAAVVGDGDGGSFSARRLMSIAVSLGYLGLPSLALGIVYGESGRALYHASARLETALLMAWHTRGSIAAFGRRWIVNSPMVRRWNQRAYRAIGMGPLRSGGAVPRSTARSRVSGSDKAQGASLRGKDVEPGLAGNRMICFRRNRPAPHPIRNPGVVSLRQAPMALFPANPRNRRRNRSRSRIAIGNEVQFLFLWIAEKRRPVGCHLTTNNNDSTLPPSHRMSRAKHPNKEVDAAIRHAEENGWRVSIGGSHAWGRIYCPFNDPTCRCGEFCIASIWSTPGNPADHAKAIRRVVDKCIAYAATRDRLEP
jgi:hypothetical protein